MTGDSSNTLLLFLLYATYVLVPLIPAIAIFYIFPDTPVVLQGPLQGLTARAGGAFAAYMIVVLLSWYIVGGIAKSIESGIAATIESTNKVPGTQMWHVETRVTLKDRLGNTVNSNDALDKLSRLTVTLWPPIDTNVINGRVSVTIPGSTAPTAHFGKIQFHIEKWGDELVDLDNASMVKRDDITQILTIDNVTIAGYGFSTPYKPTDSQSPSLGGAPQEH
jgi:hypothetical protein